MSTTLPETVTTTNTTTTTATTAPVHPNPAAALDPLTESSSSSSSSSINTAEMLEKVKAAGLTAGAAISSAAHQAAVAAQQAGAAISQAAHNVDAKYHVSDKVSDATAHMSAALKQGNPAHAVKHASTAATIGDAERAKHQAGPLPDDAHKAGATLDSTSIHTSTTLGSAESTTDKMKNAAADVSSHVSAAVAAGNPLHAAKYAGTAAMIGQVEREKHAHGPLEDEASIKAVDASAGEQSSSTVSKGI